MFSVNGRCFTSSLLDRCLRIYMNAISRDIRMSTVQLKFDMKFEILFIFHITIKWSASHLSASQEQTEQRTNIVF